MCALPLIFPVSALDAVMSEQLFDDHPALVPADLAATCPGDSSLPNPVDECSGQIESSRQRRTNRLIE
jgi:hypothetical protein